MGAAYAQQTLAHPRSISINGAALHPVIESKRLPSGREGLPVWFLPRLGLQTRNDPQDLWLGYGVLSLHFSSGQWHGLAGAERLSAPEYYGGSLHVPLDVLRLLGVPLSGTGTTLNVTVRQAARQLPALSSLGLSAALQPSSAKATIKSAAPSASSPPPVDTPKVPVAKAPRIRIPVIRMPIVRAPIAKVTATTVPAATTTPTAIIRPHIKLALPLRQDAINKLESVAPLPPLPATPPAAVPLPIDIATPPPKQQTGQLQTNQLQANQSQPSPTVPIIGPRLLGIRSSLTPIRNILAQRIVIDLTGPVQYSAQRSGGNQLSLFLLGASAQPSAQKLDSGDTLSIAPALNAAGRPGILVRLQTTGALGQVQALSNPERLAIDSATQTTDSVPPPINEDALPQGVSLRTLGGLSLLSFDPARFVPRVVAAPTGSALSVAELVQRAGGVAGVNGGYFDPPSNLSVDFVTVAGQMLSSSLEKRAAVGFGTQGQTLFGYPRPRYFAEGTFGSVLVNTVSARAQPFLLNAFIGDGRTAVGGAGLSTVLLSGGVVTRSVIGSVVPPPGVAALTFDAARFSQLPRSVGAPLTLRLDYQLPGWDTVRDGLAAGPLLIQGGRVVLNPTREAFNIYASIWRPTRQVALALYQGQPTIAFLDNGTPDTLAYALQRAGVSDALRLDSGSSATAFVAGGYLGNGGYLNTVWSRPVPNAIVFVPKQ